MEIKNLLQRLDIEQSLHPDFFTPVQRDWIEEQLLAAYQLDREEESHQSTGGPIGAYSNYMEDHKTVTDAIFELYKTFVEMARQPEFFEVLDSYFDDLENSEEITQSEDDVRIAINELALDEAHKCLEELQALIW